MGKRGRPRKAEGEKAVATTMKFPPQLWAEMNELVPARQRSKLIHRLLERELRKRRREQSTAPAHVRLATETDIPQVHQLQIEWADEESTYGYVPASEEQLRDALGDYFRVVESEGETVGFIRGSERISDGLAVIPKGERYLEIEDLYLVAPHRRRGIGTLLVDQLLTGAKQAGLHCVHLFTSTKEIHGVLRFYEQVGFRIWGAQLFQRL